MTSEERAAHDAEIKAERELLKVLSDVFEQATGRAVDLTAWGLDQLVRVLRNPNEVAGLCNSLPGGWNRRLSDAECLARAAVLGPQELIEQARASRSPVVMIAADYSALELRTLAQLDEHRRCTCAGGSPRARNYTGPHVEACPLSPRARQASKVSNFGLHPFHQRGGFAIPPRPPLLPFQAEALAVTTGRSSYAAIGTALHEGAAAMIATMQRVREELPPLMVRSAEQMRELFGRPLTLMIVDDPRGADRVDAMSYALHANMPIVMPPAMSARSFLDGWFEDVIKAEAITAPKRKRFKQARAPGEARNPMPPHTFKRARK